MKLFVNTILLLLGIIFKGGAFLLIDRLIAINIGPSHFGIFKYYITIIALFSSLSSFGFNSSIVRYLSINANNLNFIASLIRFTSRKIIIASIIIIIISQFSLTHNILNIQFHANFNIIIIALLGLSINTYIIGIYSGLGLSKGKSILNDLLGALLWFTLVYIYSFMDFALSGLCVLYLLNTLLMLLINIIYLQFNNINFFDIIFSDSKIDLSGFKRYSWPIYVTLILIVLGSHYDKMILAQFENNYLLGIYYSASIIPVYLVSILSAINFLYFPIVSSIYAAKKLTKFSLVTAYTTKWISCIAFIPSYILVAHSDEIMSAFFNSEYIMASMSFKILVLSQYLHLSIGFTGQNLLAIGESKAQMIIRFVSLIVSLILGVVFVSKWGIEGLAISVFLSLLLSNISQIIFIQYVKGYRLFYTFNYIIWIISIALFFCSWLMRNHLEVYSNYLLTIFCIVLFPIIIFILGIINKKDIKMFRIISLVK